MIVDAPWYVPNTIIRRALQIPTVKEEIRRYSSQYSVRLSAHRKFFSVINRFKASCGFWEYNLQTKPYKLELQMKQLH
jgi:hypothetical protein